MKFKFTTDFQFDLLRFTVQDKNGYKAIELYDDSYFSLVEHAVIAWTLKGFYKHKKTIPGETILIQELHKTFEHRDFINNLTDDDRKEVLSLAKKLYKGIVKDGDEILANTEQFAQYVDLKHELENVDLLDFEEYPNFARKIQKAISPKIRAIEELGSFLIKDVRRRQISYKERSSIIPLPWKQLNWLTNAGGYAKGSILVILDKAKKFKSGALINIAKQYIKMGKKVLVIDLDNGKGELMTRLEQALVGATKTQILDENGGYDHKVRDLLKRYKTIKGELVIHRMPALVTTAADIGNYMDYLYRDFGFQPAILIIDYIGKMGSISGKESLHERISDAYIDVGNLAMDKDIDLVWTAQHVTREATKQREGKVYESTDVAGAIDITRHVQALYGLNRTPLEEQKGYQRLEIIDQRDGPPSGRVVFKIDIEKQQMKPISKAELERYEKIYSPKGDSPEDNSYEGSRKSKPIKKGGDLND